MYKTAENLEELDFEMELNSYDSIGHAVPRISFFGIEEKYYDVDFYIMMINDKEEDEIKKLLGEVGYSAWLEYDLEGETKMVRIGN